MTRRDLLNKGLVGMMGLAAVALTGGEALANKPGSPIDMAVSFHFRDSGQNYRSVTYHVDARRPNHVFVMEVTRGERVHWAYHPLTSLPSIYADIIDNDNRSFTPLAQPDDYYVFDTAGVLRASGDIPMITNLSGFAADRLTSRMTAMGIKPPKNVEYQIVEQANETTVQLAGEVVCCVG